MSPRRWYLQRELPIDVSVAGQVELKERSIQICRDYSHQPVHVTPLSGVRFAYVSISRTMCRRSTESNTA